MSRPTRARSKLEVVRWRDPGQWCRRRSARLGWSFRNTRCFPHLSVKANIAFGLPRGAGRAERTREMLSLASLDYLGERMPHQLSGGQQQRVGSRPRHRARPRRAPAGRALFKSGFRPSESGEARDQGDTQGNRRDRRICHALQGRGDGRGRPDCNYERRQGGAGGHASAHFPRSGYEIRGTLHGPGRLPAGPFIQRETVDGAGPGPLFLRASRPRMALK